MAANNVLCVDDLIVSVHVPKCAGTSFKSWLLAAYGEEHTYFDYQDLPMDPSSPTNIDPEGFLNQFVTTVFPRIGKKRAIHGHFLASKYDFVKTNTFRLTFLRDPIERALSHYHFWMKIPRSQNRLHNYVQDNQLTWQEFVRLPIIKSLYSKVFFRDFDMGRFDFIGDASNPSAETQRLGKILGFSHSLGHENRTPGDYALSVREILSDSSHRKMLQALFSDEIRFYETYVGR